MNLSLFDLHADTTWAMYQAKQPLGRNSLAVSLEKAQKYERYIQTMALWTPPKLSNEEGYFELLKIVENLKNDPALQNGDAELCSACPKREFQKPSLMLSVEDARVLDGHIERVAKLADLGVKSVIPLWSGETCIGGSHDTVVGLTEFGKRTAEEIISHGMVIDISHASIASSKQFFEISAKHNKPVIASHSNAYTVCPVSRNLQDWQIDAILASGGIIGINLHRFFLDKNGEATLDSIIGHIEYFLAKGAKNSLCLGCDMDGADLLADIPDLFHLNRLVEHLLAHGYSQELINDLFFENAYQFAQKYF